MRDAKELTDRLDLFLRAPKQRNLPDESSTPQRFSQDLLGPVRRQADHTMLDFYQRQTALEGILESKKPKPFRCFLLLAGLWRVCQEGGKRKWSLQCDKIFHCLTQLQLEGIES